MDELLWQPYWHFLDRLPYYADSHAVNDKETTTDYLSSVPQYRDSHAYDGQLGIYFKRVKL